MIRVKFTSHLKRRMDLPDTIEIEGQTVRDVLENLEQKYSGVRDYIVDERGAVRKHVNIFVGEEPIKDRESLGDSVEQVKEIFIMQALSGG